MTERALSGRAPAVDPTPQAYPQQLAPTRFACGAQTWPLTVASFRTWRGSWWPAAQGQAINATVCAQSPRNLDLELEFNPARADCGFRAPLAPRLAGPSPSYGLPATGVK